MGEIIKLKRPRRQTLKGVARAIASEATQKLQSPCAVIVIALAKDGTFALRSANIEDDLPLIDTLGRAIAVLQQEQTNFMRDED